LRRHARRATHRHGLFARQGADLAIINVAVAEIAKRSPSAGALVASLPLVSVLGMIWLWRDTQDPTRLAAHAGATFWYVLPSLADVSCLIRRCCAVGSASGRR